MAQLPTAVPDPTTLGVAQPDVSRIQPRYQAGQVGEALQNVGAQMGRASDELLQTNDAIAHAQGIQDFLAKKQQLDQQFENDPDYATAPQRYNTAIQQAATQSGAGIISPIARAQFQESLTRIINFGQERVLSQSHAKSVDADRGWLDNYTNGIADQYARATDDATRQTLLDAAHTAISAVADKGSITPVEQDKINRNLAAQVTTQRAQLLADTNPDLAIRLLAPRAVVSQQQQSDLPQTQPTTAAPTSQSLPSYLPAELGGAIQAAAQAHGADADVMGRTAYIESRGGQTSANVFQFQPGTARQYGLADVNNVTTSADATARKQVDDRTALNQILGRDPTGSELYLAHQQGAAGAAALIKNPDQSAVDALMSTGLSRQDATSHITGNGGSASMTAGAFVQKWADNYGNVPVGYQRSPLAQRPSPSQSDSIKNPVDNTEYTFPMEGDWRDAIPLNERLRIVNAAQQKLNEQGVQARGDIEKRFKDNIESASDTGQFTSPLGDDEIRAAFPKDQDKAELMIRELKGAQALGQAKGQISLTSPEEDQALLGNFAPKPGDQDYADERSRFLALQSAIEAKNQALEKDPAAYVLGRSPKIAALFDRVAKSAGASMITGDQNGPTFSDAVAQLDAAYEHLGVPEEQRDVLPHAAAQGLVQKILAAPADQRAAALTGMANTYGDAWPRIMGDMVKAKLPAAYELVAAIDNPAMQTVIARAIGNGSKNTKDAIAKDDAKAVDDRIDNDEDLQDLTRAFSYADQGIAKAGEIKEALRLGSYGLVASGQSPNAAVKAAVASVTTDKYDFWHNGSGVATVPKGTLADTEAAADSMLSGLKASDLARPFYLAGQATKDVSPEEIQRATLLAAKGGTWVRNEHGDGLLRLDSNGYPVQLANGNRLELRFSDVKPATAAERAERLQENVMPAVSP